MVATHIDTRLRYLDGWRGAAIILVLLEHFGGLSTGRLGVDVFFVLSGLLISRILFEDRMPLRAFYQRRIARIFPVFYLYVFTTTLAGLWFLPTVDWRSVISAALFLRSYFPDVHIWNDPLAFGNLWSLNVEEHAYVLLSALALLAATKGERMARWALTCLTALPIFLVVLFKVIGDPGTTPFELRTEGAIFPLLASATLFVWQMHLRLQVPQWFASLTLLCTAGAALLAISDVAVGGTLIKQLVLPLLLAISVNVLSAMPHWVRSCLSIRPLTYLGLCSYSIYLWHYPFFYLENHGYWPYGRAAGFAAAMTVSLLSFYCFERPMRHWINGLQRKPLPIAATPAAGT